MPAVNRYYSSVAIDTTLKYAITDPDATTFEVDSVAGFPTSYPYTIAIGYDSSNEELVTVIGASSTVGSSAILTVGTSVAGGPSPAGRGVDGTNNQTHTAGEAVKHVISARDMTEAQAHIAAEAGAHGITGTFVGTTDTQTLTNKTITGGTVNATTLQQGGVPAVTTTGTQTLTNKTLTTPAISDATITGTTTAASGTIALGSNASAITANGATISATEVSYLDGVTSPIQTQLGTVNTALTNNTPVGAVTMWVTADAPTGWTLCQGQAISRSTFGSLFSVIGTTYGAGDGSTTFNLPDLRGRVPMGSGQGRNVANNADLPSTRVLGTKVSDNESVVLTQNQLASHTHIQDSHDHLLRYNGTLRSNTDGYIYGDIAAGSSSDYIIIPPTGFGGLANSIYGPVGSKSSPATAEGKVATNQNTGSNEAHNNTQPSTVINFIIKH